MQNKGKKHENDMIYGRNGKSMGINITHEDIRSSKESLITVHHKSKKSRITEETSVL